MWETTAAWTCSL